MKGILASPFLLVPFLLQTLPKSRLVAPSLHFVSCRRSFLLLFPQLSPSLHLSLFSGGHALECSLLHKTTRSHYLLTTPQEAKRAAFSTLVTAGTQGQLRWHCASIAHVSAQVRDITLPRVRKWCLMVSEGNPKEVDERQLSLPRNVINFSNTWRLVGDTYFPAVLSQYEKKTTQNALLSNSRLNGPSPPPSH